MRLELQVIENKKGVLNTNIEMLETFVTEKLKEYTPEQYAGDSEAAKKDRAELNKSEKALASARKELIAELMQPYQDFESRCVRLEKMIKDASSKLDAIVKAKETEEKNVKTLEIKKIWQEFNFDLVTIDKIFNPKWLNKTTKDYQIKNEMESIIKKIYEELKIIEKYSDDAETLKAFYLDSLNISDTLDMGEELKKNREKVKAEEQTREVRETKENLEQQEKELKKDIAVQKKDSYIDDLVNQSLGIKAEKKEEVNEYVISFKCTEKELNDIRKYFLEKKIVIGLEKLEF